MKGKNDASGLEEAKKRIKEAKEEKSGELRLNENQLTQLPLRIILSILSTLEGYSVLAFGDQGGAF